VTFFPQPVWYLIFDDTLVYRTSKKAPGSAIYRQHGAKTNRPKYARGQCWVSMAPSIGCGMTHAAVPLLSRLMRPGTTRTKLDAAVLLLKIVAPVFNSVKACTLVDSWYMKRLYLDQAETLGFIPSARSDGIPLCMMLQHQNAVGAGHGNTGIAIQQHGLLCSLNTGSGISSTGNGNGFATGAPCVLPAF